MKTQKIILAALIATTVSACGSTKKTDGITSISNLPSWVLNPVAKDGIAATDCVKSSGNFSIDKKMATANSRLSLAQQIDVKVEGLDKTYSNRVDDNNDMTVGNKFSSVSKQLTKQELRGSRVVRSDIVTISGKEYFCVLTTLSPKATTNLFEAIIKQSQRLVNPQDEKFLYQEFKAHKAEINLDNEIKRLTKD
ncbi:MAG: LPP20 family lipoprotein [Saccharospirillaceae bacterium]|nr:LPP20 family lipoprotein [Colwellia sp.]NRB77605.1 LPP20 family lipoprotein [Saccharospirillaceae bacterium]